MYRPAATLLLKSVVLLAIMEMTSPAFGHDVQHRGLQERWWLAWNLRPSVLLVLSGLSLWYAIGVRRLQRRTSTAQRAIKAGGPRQAGAFAAAIGFLLIALVSPVDVISEQLGSVHMVQHTLLMMVAAPLMVLGSTPTVLLWAFGLRQRLFIGRLLNRLSRWRVRGYVFWQPLLMWLLFGLTLWILHVPALYDGALRDRLGHDLQHIGFFVASCLFWRVMLDPLSRLKLSPGLSVLYLFTTSLHASALGVFMAFSPRVWYAEYQTSTALWNIAAIEDQQIAGYIMWMPGCLIYAIAAAVVFGLWLQPSAPSMKQSTERDRL